MHLPRELNASRRGWCPLSSQSGTTGTRALKTVHWTVFARRYAGRRALTGCGARIGRSPLARGSTSATSAPAPAPCFRRWRRSPPQLFSSPMAHRVLLSRRLNKRKKPYISVRLFFGAACDCISEQIFPSRSLAAKGGSAPTRWQEWSRGCSPGTQPCLQGIVCYTCRPQGVRKRGYKTWQSAH